MTRVPPARRQTHPSSERPAAVAPTAEEILVAEAWVCDAYRVWLRNPVRSTRRRVSEALRHLTAMESLIAHDGAPRSPEPAHTESKS
jgi:hypothetical protein